MGHILNRVILWILPHTSTKSLPYCPDLASYWHQISPHVPRLGPLAPNLMCRATLFTRRALHEFGDLVSEELQLTLPLVHGCQIFRPVGAPWTG